ncbi:Tripartite motif-containing protein 2 [Holothuria leucospilota]|uniref:Tripartite motif-containing protein 2 n=1 Tax=Holothuria leucospilota TaxID=206669 RepID=A0A9Q1C4X5_HOLLE|nr:Tripartite motif-containing protein 2 [Holothuria leucospilota]
MEDKRASSIENLQMNVWCSICHEPWTRPKTLPCDHIFCEECLEAVLRRTDGNSLPCPVCRTSYEVPSQGLHEAWTTSRTLENLADGFRSMEFSSPGSQLSTNSASPEHSYITNPPPKKIPIGQLIRIVVQLCNQDGQLIPAQSGRYDITGYVDLKPRPFGFERKELKATVSTQGNPYIEFQVHSCGFHEFTVQLENRSIKGSPLGISVVPRDILGCEVKGPLLGPRDVIPYEGNFLVSDGIAKAVFLVDQTGQKLQSLNIPKKMAEMFCPMAIATFQQKVFVADMKNRCIHVYENLNDFPKQFGEEQLQKPTGVTVSPDNGNIFIVDNERKLVVVFNQDYKYLKTINYRASSTEDQLFNPQMAVINKNGDKLYIADHGDRGKENFIKIINVFEDKLERKISVRVGKIQARPCGMDIDSNGNMYVTCTFPEFGKRHGEGKPVKLNFTGGINMYNSLGQFLCHFGAQLKRPNGLTVLPPASNSASIVYVADSPGNSQNGSLKGFIV